MGAAPALETAATRRVSPTAAVWIDERRAMVARMRPDGQVSTCEIERSSLPEPAYLAQVVRTIGDRERVLILGPGRDRLALEREYVSVFQRPDRLVDVEPADPTDLEALVDRLRRFAA
jgi:hypothetical protein